MVNKKGKHKPDLQQRRGAQRDGKRGIARGNMTGLKDTMKKWPKLGDQALR